jgi:ABC-type nickel/cobalt efflux system permease component RcnA
MAMSGNIAPCPAALVVLLTALSLHQVAYGIVVIIAFSIGLSGVLTTMGIAFVRGAKWLSERPAFEHLTNYGPLASACVIACIGAIMIGQGFASGSLHAPVLPVTMLALAAIAGYALRPGHVHVHAVPS